MSPGCCFLLAILAACHTPEPSQAPKPAPTVQTQRVAPPPIGNQGGGVAAPADGPLPTAEDLLHVTPHELVLAGEVLPSYPRVVEHRDGLTTVSTPSHADRVHVRTAGNLASETESRFGDRVLPDQIVTLLGVRPGMRVADVGCGGGRLAFPLARAVGAQGLVYCIDLDASAIQFARERALAGGVTNLQLIHAPFAHTLLEPGSADLALLSDVHAFQRPDIQEDALAAASLASFYASIQRGLAPHGRLVIIELTSNGRRVTGDQIQAQIEGWGFRLVQRRDELLPSHHFMVFEPSR